MEHGSRPRTHRSVARPSPARTSPAHLLSCAALRWQSLAHANQAKPSQDTTVSEVGACAVEKQEQLVQKEPEEICGVTFGDPRGGELLPRACLACPSALSHCCRRARFAGYVDTVSLLTRDYKDTIDSTTPLLDHPLTSLGNDDPAPPAPLSAPRPRRLAHRAAVAARENPHLLAPLLPRRQVQDSAGSRQLFSAFLTS